MRRPSYSTEDTRPAGAELDELVGVLTKIEFAEVARKRL
jgi:hypothetical protein